MSCISPLNEALLSQAQQMSEAKAATLQGSIPAGVSH